MEYQIRDARLTDIEQVSELIQRADPSWTAERRTVATDLLRQLLYMPSASVLVALEGRHIEGVAVLSLRPSVAARGLVGTVDLLVVDPGHELGGPIDALLKEIVRSARNKGCVVLEATRSDDPITLSAMERAGFAEQGGQLTLPLAAARLAPR